MRPNSRTVLLALSFYKITAAQFPVLPVPEFSYSGSQNGPSTWAQKFQSCGGQKQSPIDLSVSSATKTDFPNLIWSEYVDTSRTGALLNNWQGVQLMIGPESLPEAKIRGGPLLSEYVLGFINFKWGNELGSEHSIDKYFYGLEAQLVHFKKSARNPESALKEADGFAIVSVLFGINQKSNLTELDPIVNNLKNVVAGGALADLPSGKYLSWLKKYVNPDCSCTKETYYTYTGSLTSPPCTENVIWIVMANPIPIGVNQLKEFQRIKGITDVMISDNKRPIQQLNNRKLQYKQDASIKKCHSFILILIMLLCRMW